MNMKNQIIIDKIDFFINNFNDTGVDYKVEVYAQDIEESDMYGIDIYKIHNYNDVDDESSHEIKERVSTLYVDSCGGYETPGAKLTELEDYILNILFVDRQHGIVRGF